MNGGGPTAQIVDRGNWKANRDFVGHKKAVSCARFNGRVFEKANGSNGKTEMFVVVALGSRDRSFSVWSTNLKRPFFVINDAFDQGVLDLSWTKDGKVLLACSMDGSIAAVTMSQDELGKAVPEHRYTILYKQLTEKSFNNLAGKKVYLLFFGHFEFFYPRAKL
jgi:protein HIRA/HIR1